MPKRSGPDWISRYHLHHIIQRTAGLDAVVTESLSDLKEESSHAIALAELRENLERAIRVLRATPRDRSLGERQSGTSGSKQR